jgi:F-type H+-transporting ATPase subunit delta
VPLTDAQKAALLDKLQAMDGRTVSADYHLDASLLGGVVVELDDRVLDGSLKQQIRKLKEVIDS